MKPDLKQDYNSKSNSKSKFNFKKGKFENKIII